MDSTASASAGFRRRRAAIRRRRLNGRVLRTGHVLRWIFGIGAVAVIATIEVVGLR